MDANDSGRRINLGSNGFTLIELVVVIAIITILAAISVIAYARITETTRTNVLKANTSTLESLLRVYGVNYEKDKWYGNWSADGDGTLNNFMESHLETMQSGHYSNDANFVNPISQNMSVLDYSSTLSSGDGYRPAIFMTSNTAYSYTGTGSTANIIGTIVAYFHVSSGITEYIDLYFVDQNGVKSEFTKRIT